MTFSRTASRVEAAPLCRYGRLAKTAMSDGTLKPSRPARLDILLVVRADLVAHAVGEEVWVEGANPAEEPDELGLPIEGVKDLLWRGGGVKSRMLFVQLGTAVALVAAGALKGLPTRIDGLHPGAARSVP